MTERQPEFAGQYTVLLSCIFGVDFYDRRFALRFAQGLSSGRPDPIRFSEDAAAHWGGILEDSARSRLMVDSVNRSLETLTDKERRLLEVRYGLGDGQLRTLLEVGKEFGVTRERIRQIEAHALRKLRHPSRSERLKPFLPD